MLSVVSGVFTSCVWFLRRTSRKEANMRFTLKPIELATAEPEANILFARCFKQHRRPHRSFDTVDVFTVSKVPGMDIVTYIVDVLGGRLGLSHEEFELAQCYFYRVQQRVNVTDRTEHYIAAGLLLLAHKFLLDRPYSNSLVAQASGIPKANLNMIEQHLLTLLDWCLYAHSVHSKTKEA